MPLVSIVIPVYKTVPDRNEELSFLRCLEILGNYPITIICPLSLDIEQYAFLSKEKGKQIVVERFDDYFFKSIVGYNQLMIYNGFYKRFENHDFILIYQLDAYVFRDELKQWCEQGFDFIGAPLFTKWIDPDKTYKFIGGSNGGLSLRRVEASLRILGRVDVLRKLKHFYFFLALNNLLPYLKILKLFKWAFNIMDVSMVDSIDTYMDNEDYLWSNIFASGFTDYHVAPPEIALKFSFEVNSSFLYAKNNKRLPFGCHAWEKYEPQFWKQFIN